MEMLSLFVLGCIVGLFAGLIPGVGVFTALILLYPLLIDLSIQELLVLYIPIASISQFIGSVPALFFKIPGEATSFIATEYGHKLFHNGHHDLIPLTAIGSFIATILSAGIFHFSLAKVNRFELGFPMIEAGLPEAYSRADTKAPTSSLQPSLDSQYRFFCRATNSAPFKI